MLNMNPSDATLASLSIFLNMQIKFTNYKKNVKYMFSNILVNRYANINKKVSEPMFLGSVLQIRVLVR